MRKWLGIYIAVCAAALCILSGAVGTGTAGRADFGRVKEESGCVCQVVQTKDNSYVLYRRPEQKKFRAAKTEASADGVETLDTTYCGEVYYLYRGEKNGRQFFGIDALTDGGGESWEAPLLEAEGKALAFSSNEREFICGIQSADGAGITEYSLSLAQPEEWTIKAAFDLPKGHFAVCGAYEGEDLWFALEDGRVYRRTTVLEPVNEAAEDTLLAGVLAARPLEDGIGTWKAYWILETAKMLLIPVLAGGAVFVFLLYGARKRNHIVFRLLCCTEVLCCAAMLFAGWHISEGLTKQKVLEIGVEAGHLLGEMQAGQNADGTIAGDAYWTAMEERKALLDELMILRPDGSVLLAKTLPAGAKAAAYYGEDIDGIIAQVVEGNRTVMTRLKNRGSRPYVVAMRDWTAMQPDSVLLTVLSESGLERAVKGQTVRVWHTLTGLLVALTLLHLWLYAYFSKKWENFVKGISFVATEKKAYPEVPAGRDGLQSVWVPLDRIGHNLSELYYERDRFYRSYYRFVPKDMERLLNKPEIVDMEIGDRNKIRGCMVHFVLEEQKRADGADYMEIMTASMELLHQERKKWDGIYLSGTADLLERKIFFERNARSAAQFAIELLHAFAGHEILGDKNLIMMLYAADFQYGISGVKDMTTPYMYAREERTLEPYVKSLARAKVRLAMTEQTVKLLGAGFSVRYIGFVTNGDEACSLKLYECLDAYPEKQRRVMLETDRLFQKGLQLFYSDDFYLARNTFNEVLKINEQDCIARWYLFHCEYHLNQTDAVVSYGLFENTVLAQEYDNL